MARDRSQPSRVRHGLAGTTVPVPAGTEPSRRDRPKCRRSGRDRGCHRGRRRRRPGSGLSQASAVAVAMTAKISTTVPSNMVSSAAHDVGRSADHPDGGLATPSVDGRDERHPRHPVIPPPPVRSPLRVTNAVQRMRHRRAPDRGQQREYQHAATDVHCPCHRLPLPQAAPPVRRRVSPGGRGLSTRPVDPRHACRCSVELDGLGAENAGHSE